MRDDAFGRPYSKWFGGATRHGPLGAVLALALLLRLGGNLYDMPYRFHPDEHHFVDKAVTMMRDGTLNPGYFKNPPLYTYVLLIALHALYGAQYVAGVVGSRAEFVAAIWPVGAFGLARGVTALAGTVTCLLLFLIGRRIAGRLAGLLAAGLYAVAYLSVRDGHFAVNDVPLVTLITLAFWFAVRCLQNGQTGNLMAGALSAGLAAATKYNGAIALLPLLVTCLLRRSKGEKVADTVTATRVGLQWVTVLGVALAGFLLGNPYAVFDSEAFLSDFRSQYGLRQAPWEGQRPGPVALLELEALQVELGWPLLLFFPLAAAHGLRSRGLQAKVTLLALSVVLPLIAYHASQALFFARFLLPCTPFMALICAWGIVSLRDAHWPPWMRHPAVFWGIVGLLVATPLARSTYLNWILHRPDTRILAKDYVERVAPPASVTVIQKPSMFAPPLDAARHRVVSLRGSPFLLSPTGVRADLYLFNSFEIGHVRGLPEAYERALMGALERERFTRITFSPLRDGSALPFEADQVYLPYRHLFRYERPGPWIVLYARPGITDPTSAPAARR
jgi:4-amino-4-deoxy-L-arabinose transferase-like glycosyltransferase